MAVVITRAQRRRAIAGAAVLLLLVGVVVGLVARGDAGDEGAGGSPLPDQRFDLFDGGRATFADFTGDGRPLVVNFWASWCPACAAELPEFQRVHADLADEVTFLGIANADLRGPALGLAEATGLTYPLADDPQGELFRELGLIAMPSTVFVGADGEIAEVFAGQLDEDGLRSRIAVLGVSS